MNKILYLICAGSVALAISASGATLQTDTSGTVVKKRGGARAEAAVKTSSTGKRATVNSGASVRNRTNVSGERFRQRNIRSTSSADAKVNRAGIRHNRGQTMKDSNVVTRNRVHANNEIAANRTRNFKRDRNITVNRERNVTRHIKANRERNVTRNIEVNRNRHRNVVVTNNWRDSRFSGERYAAFRNYHREHHNRDWWHRHYTRIVFVSGGWWAWNAGYWYPALGYDPAYTYYAYDGPIYTGSAVLGPEQVVVNVQAELQREGYYVGPVDGLLGPMTRQALANYQADHGLVITSTIDEPTLDTLGVA